MFRRINLFSSLKAARRHTSTSSHSIGNCPFRSFAKYHPEVARLVLKPPLFAQIHGAPFDHGSSNTYDGESLEAYMKWRGWDVNIKRVLEEHNLGDELVESAIGLTSHPLTFPLTLGRHVKYIPQIGSRIDKKTYRICCVGARSECTLPDEYWKEFLVMASVGDLQCNNDAGLNNSGQAVHWVIDFVGPDVPKQLQTKTISLFDVKEEQQTRVQHSLTMNYHPSFLHEIILQLLKQLHSRADTTKNDRLETIRQHWDAFVLFNPGLGHPNLAKDWESTMKFLLKTDRQILLTAHSEVDALRDLQVLQSSEEGASRNDIDVGYQLNPYASRMEFVDPFARDQESVHTVRPNHSVIHLDRLIQFKQ